MNYLLKKGGRFYYNRRVPLVYRDYDSREIIRIALKTDSRQLGMKLAFIQNDKIERYWQSLVATGQRYSHSQYQQAVAIASTADLSYTPIEQLANGSLDKIIERLHLLNKQKLNPLHTQALLGTISPPDIKLDEALLRFWDFTKDRIMYKSPNQIRRWRSQRERSMKNFIACVGNKALKELTRNDTIKFRDWWLKRIEDENLVSNSANKNLVQVKNIIETVNENLQLNLDTRHLFQKLILAEDDQGKRLPLDTSYITSVLLNPENLQGLNEHAKAALHIIAETGVGLAEQTSLLPEDIHLDSEIPHIILVPRKGSRLKTKYRARKIPLIGFALDAFKAFPNGFPEYRDRPDALSSLLSDFLRVRNLLPSKQHSVYSLRHSFQDRLLRLNAPDRIQAELMGHKFHRPSYGDGPSLAHKLEWLIKTQLKILIYQ